MRPVHLLLAISLALSVGCHRPVTPTSTLTLATTTSTQDSGLLDMLVPMFREQTGIEVKAGHLSSPLPRSLHRPLVHGKRCQA